MATKLFFHAANNALSGTFPTGEQSTFTADWNCANASTLKVMDLTAGVSQTSRAGTTSAIVSSQRGFLGFFCTDTFDVNQTVGGGGQTLTLNIAHSISDITANIGASLSANVYVWRPSTGVVVGTICANLNLSGDANATSTGELCDRGTSISTTLVNALAGDVLICEAWHTFSQTSATALDFVFYFDGTTQNNVSNTSVSNHASYLNLSADTLTFGTPVSTLNGDFAATLAAESLAASGSVVVSGTFVANLSDFSLSAAGIVADPIIYVGNFSATLAPFAFSSSGSKTLLGSSQSGGGGGGKDYGHIPSRSSNRAFTKLLDNEFKPKRKPRVVAQKPAVKPTPILLPKPEEEREEDYSILLLLAVL